MGFYRVRLARAQWFEMVVEAENEDKAIDEAIEQAPGISAQDSGWGSSPPWSVDAEDWVSLEDFFGENYDPSGDKTVTEITEEEAQEHAQRAEW